MKRTLFGLIVTVAMFLSANCFADTHHVVELKNWKAECIGRYQISVPGEVEVALNSSKRFFDESGSDFYRFSDETIAYFSAGYSVYPQMDSKESLEFISAFKKRFDKGSAERAKEIKALNDTKLSYWMFFKDDINKRDYAWVEPGFYSLFIFRNGHYFNFRGGFDESNNSAKDTEKSVAEVNADINAFRPRPLYTLQNQPGVCIPYGFIADDGTAPRDIGVTMRLIDHPEVEVFFQDSSYQLSPGEHSESEEEITLFLKQYARPEKYLNTGLFGTHSIKLAGQKGRGIFFTIVHKDESVDYGYIASVKGDFAASTDTPAQMLYVIRTASRAKGKPVSKDELKDIAEKILASVKPHAVQ